MDNELSASPKMDDRLTLVAALDLAIASGRDFHGLPLAQLRAALRQDSSGGVLHDMARILQTACDADEGDPRKLLQEIADIASKHPWPLTPRAAPQERK
jgi:hypothetical protein